MRGNLKKLFLLLFLMVGANIARASSGTIFVREKATDGKTFRAVFLAQASNLKSNGFLAYSLHRDLKDKTTFILTLKCSDLDKGVSFIRSPEFMAAMDKAGAQIPQIWYGLDVQERLYMPTKIQVEDGHEETFMARSKKEGIVIARNEVRDYDFWLKCFQAQNHNHEGRKYKNSGYSLHRLSGNPAVAIVVHEASDVSKAPQFMTSDHMNGEMESTGVVGLEIWYGINIEEGVF